ncbi:conserved hypothetical protein [Thiomonas arsenitoxydans]|uniref:Uncharacterized protein n=1 Tax=Thiomonas arsenitoxydans (strain DSM 22701 / CIP 110005 / 3As) TaxID=426114 RepID=D6CRL3_THIA3|nr:hypothetical protein THI_0511 [Thiomonas arsenitoxydans]CQR29067.1 conserved hypothetical protein [Thiomonas arsenitoxydans]CQR30103.1 conserved hypothetical protein [Thiomonas arsenitoxydans]
MGHHPRADSRAWLRNIWAIRVVACQTKQGDVNGEAS